jgi:internalin A
MMPVVADIKVGHGAVRMPMLVTSGVPRGNSMTTNSSEASVAPRKTPWYVPTPAKYLVFVLLVQIALYLSQQYQWFWFNRTKGYGVLITFGVTALLLLGMVAWMCVGRFFKAKAQFSLAILMLMVPVMGVPCGWLAREYEQARQQEAVVATAVSRKFEVSYYSEPPLVEDGVPLRISEGLVWALGSDFFTDVLSLKISDAQDADLEVVARFTRLSLLFLDNAKVTDEGMKYLRGHPHLQEIMFFSAPERITEVAIQYIKEIPHLESINLEKTMISDAGIKELGALKELRSFQFDARLITDEGLADLAGFAQLSTVDLSDSQITDSGLERLKTLKNLERLKLSNTAVTDLGAKHLKELPELDWLDLDETKVTDVGLAEMSGLTKMRFLELKGTEVTDAGLVHLKGMTELRSLRLDRTRITDQGLAELAGLTQLVSLHLSGTRVTDAGIEKLQRLTNMERLGLSDTQVGNASLEWIKLFTRLEYLHVSNTRVTKVGEEKLKKHLPQCRMLRY